MSGHSKWASIKHKKGAADAKRGKLFTKYIKAITVAARQGGGDPDKNPALRLAISTAKNGNMPNDNIDRAVKKGTGDIEGVSYENIYYEGYGPKGVALYVYCLTDNKNRIAAEIRNIFAKNNGNMAGAGSVAWLFEQKGLITVMAATTKEETLMDIAIEAGAEDFSKSGDVFEIITSVQDFEQVKEALTNKAITPESAELTYIPKNQIPVNAEEAKKIMQLIDALEDNDDVQNVYVNFELPDELMNE